MMERLKANLTSVGRGSMSRGLAIVVVGLVVVLVLLGLVLDQPTAAAGGAIGWVVATLVWGGAGRDREVAP